jgi:hypothetical protein
VQTGPNNDILCLQQKRKFLLSNKACAYLSC